MPPVNGRSTLLWSVRSALAAEADPERAPAMQAYMKSAMPFHGVGMPRVRAVCRRVFAGADDAFEGDAAWREAVLTLWRGAGFREERYAAIELAGHRRARPFRTMSALPMLEEMIVTGAWWDLVDPLASHRLGELLAREPDRMRRAMRAWARCEDLWKRRSAILCQLRLGAETDTELLYDCIQPSLDSREFFLRKAIGWALRQYAWTDPGEITRYVRANESRLSGLSTREALKNVSLGSARAREES